MCLLCLPIQKKDGNQSMPLSNAPFLSISCETAPPLGVNWKLVFGFAFEWVKGTCHVHPVETNVKHGPSAFNKWALCRENKW